MKNDELCDLCNEKPKESVIKLWGKEQGVCSNCNNLVNAPDRPEVPDIDRGKRFA